MVARPFDLFLLVAGAAGSACTRRALVSATPAVALGPAVAAPAVAAPPAVEALSIDDAVRLIATDCDAAWLAGVRGGNGGLLYRGVPGAAAGAKNRKAKRTALRPAVRRARRRSRRPPSRAPGAIGRGLRGFLFAEAVVVNRKRRQGAASFLFSTGKPADRSPPPDSERVQ